MFTIYSARKVILRTRLQATARYAAPVVSHQPIKCTRQVTVMFIT